MLLAPSSVSGLGLFANKCYQQGYVLGIIEGPVTDEPTDFAIEPKPGLYIETGPPFRFANHSCSPNIELLGERLVVTKHAVETGDELFFDYSTFIFDDWTMTCSCGESGCRGVISANYSMS